MTNLRVDISTDLTAANVVAQADLSCLGYQAGVNLANFIQAVSSGQTIGEINAAAGAVAATGAVVFTDNPSNDETVTIANVVFTAKTSGATGNQWNIGVSATANATALAAAINASSDLTGVVVATSSVGTVTLTAVTSGKIGNGLAIAEALSNATVTAFTGGTNGTLYELNIR